MPSKQALKVRLSLTIGRSADDRVGHIRTLSARVGDDTVEIDFNNLGRVQSITAMGYPVLLKSSEEWWVGPGNILPNLLLLEERRYQVDEDEFESFKEVSDRPFGYLVDSALRDISHKNTSLERLYSIGSRLLYGEEGEFFRHLINTPGVTSSLEHRVKQIGPTSPEVRALRRAVMLRHLSSFMQALDEELVKFANSVRYIEPIRANAERYYREQDLAVDDIDSSGANTAMFLSSLDGPSLVQLQDWMVKNFGFLVEVKSGTGHIQINISDGVSNPRNIADLGFGYSQLLPIILQLWRSSRVRKGEVSPTLAIEQPELHLHPCYQAMLADVIVATAVSGRTAILVETHSDHFVNRLGALAAEGRVDADDLQVLVVAEDEFGDSVATKVTFDSDGTLSSEWPVGFFTPQPLI